MSEKIDVVTGVHFYVVKSCHETTINGQLPTELEVGPTGFVHAGFADRGWVVNGQDDLAITQRGWDDRQTLKHKTDRILATVATDIRGDHVHISKEGFGFIRVPLCTDESSRRSVKIFGPEMSAIDEGEEASWFFSDLLHRFARLSRNDPRNPRELPDKYSRFGAANMSAGADGRPFSLDSQESLDELHDDIGWPRGTVPNNRFRSNINIAGRAMGAFGEDKIRIWRIGNVVMHDVKALTRCPMPNNDQDTADNNDQLSTALLRPTRYGWATDGDVTGRAEPLFGQSLNHEYDPDDPQTIKVTDPVVALEVGEPNVVLRHLVS